ncbi:hypothetical protein ACFVS2_25650 [Brevibacillus sp. NPDC058079]|uniref:hypothetical protein n=1 Tax=Brevibacillus sp. NPDC058079 TaxID=3346330 RepID=UPI0036F17637
MGSISREKAIFDFIKTFGEKFNKHYAKLVGLHIKELKEVQVNYYVKGTVRLSDNSEYPVHYRWSGEDEDRQGKELDKHFTPIAEYYQEHLLGKEILSARLGYADRDDEAYILLFVNEDTDVYMAIPVGFDPEQMEISGLAEELIRNDEFELFVDNR